MEDYELSDEQKVELYDLLETFVVKNHHEVLEGYARLTEQEFQGLMRHPAGNLLYALLLMSAPDYTLEAFKRRLEGKP